MKLTPQDTAWLWQAAGTFAKAKDLTIDIVNGNFGSYGKPDAMVLMETLRMQTNLLTEFIKNKYP